jgi:uncharacterized membrane protein
MPTTPAATDIAMDSTNPQTPAHGRSAAGRLMRHIRKKLLAGMVTITPIAVALFVGVWIFRLITGAEWVRRAAAAARQYVPGISNDQLATAVTLILTLLLLYIAGTLSSNFTVRQIIGLAERIVVRIPIVKLFYVTSKQLVDTLMRPTPGTARKVVVIEYPRKGVFGFGFATEESRYRDRTLVHVFVPTTPNPTSGWLLLVDSEEVFECSYGGEEAMRLILSGGIVCKEALELRPYSGKAGAPRPGIETPDTTPAPPVLQAPEPIPDSGT